MNASDLRTGNIVYYLCEDKLDDRQQWYEPSVIDWQDIKYLAEKEERNKGLIPDTSEILHYKPIPLTEEWLLKFGLEERYVKGEWSWANCKNGDTKWSSYTEISNTKNSGATIGYIYNRDYPEIIYVHQLQNLYFDLTGEELTIKTITP